MALSDEDRIRVEDTIMDLHYTSQKYIETSKDIHRKLLEVNVQEAIEVLRDVEEHIKDDPKRYDYKMHLMIPFQMYELMIMRQRKEEGE